MNHKLIKKILKIAGLILLVILGILAYFIYDFTSPLTEVEVLEKFENVKKQPHITYREFKGHQVRVVAMQQQIDTSKPTLFFVHGSPGSSMDFYRYLSDTTLNSLANIMTYDRIGYGPEKTGEVLSSIDEEVELLHQLVKGFDLSRIFMIGYSYGGTVVMASDLFYRKKIALAASVRGDLEPMFWAMNLYSWKLTRPMVPDIFKGASIEKFRHVHELGKFANKWGQSPSKVLSIHGKEDFIVPFENSEYLKRILEPSKFDLIPIEDGGHSLIWTNFDLIKKELIKSIKE